MHYLRTAILILTGVSIGRSKETQTPEEGYLCSGNMLTTKILSISEDKDWEEELIGKSPIICKSMEKCMHYPQICRNRQECGNII